MATPYIKRIVDDELQFLMSGLPAVAIEGAKAVGKTATALRLARTSLSLDDGIVRESISAYPRRIGNLDCPVFVDEWQNWPPVWDTVRHLVDDGASAGSFVLAGSLTPIGSHTHSGAGRIVTLRMRPLSLAERGLDQATVSLGEMLTGQTQQIIAGEAKTTLADYVRELASSGFPGIRALPAALQVRELRGYVEAIVTREFPQQGLTLRQPETLFRWLRAYAAATGTIATYSTILDAATPGENDKPSKATTIAYRDILQSLWLLDEVPPWAEGEEFYTRVSQTPKHFLADPALAMTLLELDADDLLGGAHEPQFEERYGSITGRLFESLVALSLQVYAQAAQARMSYFRTRDGVHEVDFIIERKRKVVAIEVKLAPQVDDNDVRHLVWLRDKLGGRLADAVIVTTGPVAYRRPDGIAVVPASLLGP